MDYVQINYDRVMSNGLAGSLVDQNDVRLFSFVAQEDVFFGRVISAGLYKTGTRSALLGGGSRSATAGYLVGNPTVAEITSFRAISDGSCKITIDGSAVTLTGLDFSSVLTYGDVADVINTALSTDGTCTFSAATGCFTITSPTTGSLSAVTKFEDNTSGTSIAAELGMTGTVTTVAGQNSYTATVLGVVVRSVTVESKDNGANSNLPVVRANDVGCYMQDGLIKVQTLEDATVGGDVYFDNVTGVIYANSGAGRTKLGTSKFHDSASAGQIVAIDIIGLR